MHSDGHDHFTNCSMAMKAGMRINEFSPPLLLLLGTAFNMLALYIFSRSKFRDSTTAYFLRALAVSDSVALNIGMWDIWMKSLAGFDIRLQSKFTCLTFKFWMMFFCELAAWLLVLTAMERCVAVLMPHKVKAILTKKNARILICITVVVLVGVNIPQILITTYEEMHDDSPVTYAPEVVQTAADTAAGEPETAYGFESGLAENMGMVEIHKEESTIKNEVSESGMELFDDEAQAEAEWFPGIAHGNGCCNINTNYNKLTNINGILELIFLSLGPFFCMMVCNIIIIARLVQASVMRKKLSGGTSTHTEPKMTSMTANLLSVSVAFLLLSAPNSIYQLLQLGDPNRFFTDANTNTQTRDNQFLFVSCLELLRYINHACNFLLYCVSGKRFWIEVEDILCKRQRRESQTQSTGRTTRSTASTPLQYARNQSASSLLDGRYTRNKSTSSLHSASVNFV